MQMESLGARYARRWLVVGMKLSSYVEEEDNQKVSSSSLP